jgi:mono/diheme cytochrome c family protein
MKKILTSFLFFLLFTLGTYADNGKKVFETYCWGCHHQTAMAFGPSFSTIASQRTAEEIEAMITDPEGVSKVFGYKRNAMPALKLKPEELKAITAYILSFKDVSDEDNASKKEENKTIIEEPYPNIATAKETH